MSDPRTTPSIFTRGAVDLGALKDRSAANRAAAPPRVPANANGSGAPPDGDQPSTGAASSGPMIVDVSEATFQTEVLERSLTTPVVIDFWADWCGPCKQLSPVLEKLAREANGAWVLAKVDVDANPRLSQMFRVQGIPMVYAIVGGQPVDAFTGVMPESQLRPWLDAILQNAGVPVEIPEDPELVEADNAMIGGDLEAAERAYKKILSDRPADLAAEAGLAQVGLLRRVQGVDPAGVLAAASAKPDDLAAQSLAADVEAASGHADLAYARLIDFIRRSAGDDREKARAHLVSLFTIAGPDDPVVATARRSLASALF